MREFALITTAGGITIAGNNTVIFVNSAGTGGAPNIEFLRFWTGQAQNATSAQQRIQLETQASAFPTLVSATPQKMKPSDPNASVITGATTGANSTCGINASAEGAGSKTVYWEDAFNVLNGWLHVPTPPETKVLPGGWTSGLGLYFSGVPGTTAGWTAGCVFREV